MAVQTPPQPLFTTPFIPAAPVQQHMPWGMAQSSSALVPNMPTTQVSAVTTPEAPQASTCPATPPFELEEENLERLKKWFLEQFGRTVFSTERNALSRYPVLTCAPEDSDEADDEAICAAMTAAAAEATVDEVGRVVDMQQVEEDARRDKEYQLLRECVANNGWAEQKEGEHEALWPSR
ncbi:hypothetical protein O3P69_016499 [Scylla paramamosain]|uniref:Uncharacterized protein n=1 Tax=Scylla paramamosain TaxID=85552 RepID=A0AAW0TDW6_SCYPA